MGRLLNRIKEHASPSVGSYLKTSRQKTSKQKGLDGDLPSYNLNDIISTRTEEVPLDPSEIFAIERKKAHDKYVLDKWGPLALARLQSKSFIPQDRQIDDTSPELKELKELKEIYGEEGERIHKLVRGEEAPKKLERTTTYKDRMIRHVKEQHPEDAERIIGSLTGQPEPKRTKRVRVEYEDPIKIRERKDYIQGLEVLLLINDVHLPDYGITDSISDLLQADLKKFNLGHWRITFETDTPTQSYKLGFIVGALNEGARLSPLEIPSDNEEFSALRDGELGFPYFKINQENNHFFVAGLKIYLAREGIQDIVKAEDIADPEELKAFKCAYNGETNFSLEIPEYIQESSIVEKESVPGQKGYELGKKARELKASKRQKISIELKYSKIELQEDIISTPNILEPLRDKYRPNRRIYEDTDQY